MNLPKYALLSTLLLAFPVSAFAQSKDEPEPTTSTTLVVTGPNIPTRTYAAKNLSIHTSTGYSYGKFAQEVSISLGLLAPPDSNLQQWMKLCGPASARKVAITVSTKEADGTVREVKYMLDGVRIMNFSASHYSDSPGEFMVQMVAETMVITGGKN